MHVALRPVQGQTAAELLAASTRPPLYSPAFYLVPVAVGPARVVRRVSQRTPSKHQAGDRGLIPLQLVSNARASSAVTGEPQVNPGGSGTGSRKADRRDTVTNSQSR